jgi:hypothetical protein
MTELEWLASSDPHEMLNHLEAADGGWLQGILARLGFRSRDTSRKLQLFACACCRRVWQLLADERSRQAVEVVERFADGLAGRQEFRRARSAATAAAASAIEPGLAAGPWLAAAHARAADAVAALFDRREAAHRAAAWAGEAARAWGKGATVDLGRRAKPPLPLPFNREAPWRRKKRKRSHKPGAQRPDRPAADAIAADAAWQTERTLQSDLLRDIFGNPYRPVVLDRSLLPVSVASLAGTIYEERAFERLTLLGDALQEAGYANEDVLNHCQAPGTHVRGCWVVDLLRAAKQ